MTSPSPVDKAVEIEGDSDNPLRVAEANKLYAQASPVDVSSLERVAEQMHYAACAFGAGITVELAAQQFPWKTLDQRRREGVIAMARAAIASHNTEADALPTAATLSARSIARHLRDHRDDPETAGLIESLCNEIDRLKQELK